MIIDYPQTATKIFSDSPHVAVVFETREHHLKAPLHSEVGFRGLAKIIERGHCHRRPKINCMKVKNSAGIVLAPPHPLYRQLMKPGNVSLSLWNVLFE